MAISDRGFASMSPARRREISSKGGKASGAARAARSGTSRSKRTAKQS
jgi:general stress protein YciG